MTQQISLKPSSMKDKQFCDDHWQQYQMHLDLKLKREVQPKKIDVVKEMDRIERRESLEEGKSHRKAVFSTTKRTKNARG